MGTGAWDGGKDSFQPSLLLLSGNEYLNSITAWSLFWCGGLYRPRHSVITTYGWGIGRNGGRKSCPASGDWRVFRGIEGDVGYIDILYQCGVDRVS